MPSVKVTVCIDFKDNHSVIKEVSPELCTFRNPSVVINSLSLSIVWIENSALLEEHLLLVSSSFLKCFPKLQVKAYFGMPCKVIL